MTLQVVQAEAPHTAAKALYFLTADLDGVHGRARTLGCLSAEAVHGEPGGEPGSSALGRALVLCR